MKMKKLVSLCVAAAMMMGCLTACGSDNADSKPSSDAKESSSSQQETSSQAEGGEEKASSGEEDTNLANEPIELDLFIDIPWFWLDK